MAWAAIVATAISAYASSQEADDQREEGKEDTMEVLRERFRLEDERAAANRARMSAGMDAWSAYGQGGAQGGMWGTPATATSPGTPASSFNPGLLNPAAFQQRNGTAPPPMPWNMQQPPQQGRGW